MLEEINCDLSADTFDWVFALEKYKYWEAGRGVSILWVHDGTGAGHTILTLKVLDRLMLLGRGSQTPDAPAVAYCFC